MKRHHLITLLTVPLFWISCSTPRAAIEDVAPEAPTHDTETGKKLAVSAERMALLDSVVAMQANDALNFFVLAQRKAAKGRIKEALGNTALSLKVYETADVMVFKGALFLALGRDDEATHWFEKAYRLDPFVDIYKYNNFLKQLK